MLKRNILLFVSLVCLLAFPSVGYCGEETYTITQTQYQQLMNNLTALENINQTLLEALQKSEMESSEVLKQSIEQKKEITILRNQLLESKNKTDLSLTQLEKANKELENLSKSLKKLEEQKNDLKAQRNILAGIGTGLLIALCVK